VSVFVFDRKSLEPPSGASSGLSLRSSSSSGLKVIQEEVVGRLKREASSLARLRHPAILELIEPVEETRSGGLQFVTEQVTGSLGQALKDKDEAGGNAGRGSRYIVDDGQGGLRRREVEIDELDIQKGLLQIAKGLEFLHESAGLTHCNLTPEAVYINAKVGLIVWDVGETIPHIFSSLTGSSLHLLSQPPMAVPMGSLQLLFMGSLLRIRGFPLPSNYRTTMHHRIYYWTLLSLHPLTFSLWDY